MTQIQYTGDADEHVCGRYRDDIPMLRFERGETLDVSDAVAAEAVARYSDVAYAPPRCGVVTDDDTPCERAVEAVGATCHQHDRDEESDDDRTYLEQARDDE